jgi:hypothetical protein
VCVYMYIHTQQTLYMYIYIYTHIYITYEKSKSSRNSLISMVSCTLSSYCLYSVTGHFYATFAEVA